MTTLSPGCQAMPCAAMFMPWVVLPVQRMSCSSAPIRRARRVRAIGSGCGSATASRLCGTWERRMARSAATAERSGSGPCEAQLR
ncbi:MAG: hypothetical protein U0232_32115 [Thermomicrobiales bacterium]